MAEALFAERGWDTGDGNRFLIAFHHHFRRSPLSISRPIASDPTYALKRVQR
jgi:hypothetical protein